MLSASGKLKSNFHKLSNIAWNNIQLKSSLTKESLFWKDSRKPWNAADKAVPICKSSPQSAFSLVFLSAELCYAESSQKSRNNNRKVLSSAESNSPLQQGAGQLTHLIYSMEIVSKQRLHCEREDVWWKASAGLCKLILEVSLPYQPLFWGLIIGLLESHTSPECLLTKTKQAHWLFQLK